MERWEDWEKKHAKKPEEAGPAPLRDLQLETLAEVMRGNILVQNHCYRADEMAVMLQVAEEFGYAIRAFHHALEAYKLRDRLAEKGVAVATWADWWGFKMEAWDGIPENAGLVSQAGGRAVIHSDSALGIQRLNQEAGKALWRARESGIPLTEEEALRWVTLQRRVGDGGGGPDGLAGAREDGGRGAVEEPPAVRLRPRAAGLGGWRRHV